MLFLFIVVPFPQCILGFFLLCCTLWSSLSLSRTYCSPCWPVCCYFVCISFFLPLSWTLETCFTLFTLNFVWCLQFLLCFYPWHTFFHAALWDNIISKRATWQTQMVSDYGHTVHVSRSRNLHKQSVVLTHCRPLFLASEHYLAQILSCHCMWAPCFLTIFCITLTYPGTWDTRLLGLDQLWLFVRVWTVFFTFKNQLFMFHCMGD